MKVVATVKLRSAQEALLIARFFQQPLFNLIKAPAKVPPVKKQLWVGMSSDRGLCGGINSSISRGVRDSIVGCPSDITDRGIVLYGEKCRSGLNTQFGSLFRTTLSDCDKNRPVTFYQCGELADYWLAQNADKTLFFYQRFKSMIAYVTTIDEFYSYDFMKDSLEATLAIYEQEGADDTIRNLVEFTSAVKLFHYFAENNASTLSARMQAMGNSSTNANDMIATLTLFLNRSRQAKITTELSEIVGGAAAVDEEMEQVDTDDIIPRGEGPDGPEPDPEEESDEEYEEGPGEPEPEAQKAQASA